MYTKYYWAIALLLACWLPSLSAQKATRPVYLQYVEDGENLPDIKNKFDHFKQQIMGHFGNKRQAKEHPTMGEKEQEFIIIPIWQERPNEFWIYLEFFSPSMHDAPIDQRIEQYVRVNRDSIRMEVYYLKEPLKYVNEWKKPTPFESLTKDDLIRDNNCDLYIVPLEDQPNTYETRLPNHINCSLKSTNGAAKYIVLWFRLSDKGYEMQFKFFDQEQQPVWQGHVIEFDRLDYRQDGYINYAPGIKPIKKKP